MDKKEILKALEEHFGIKFKYRFMRNGDKGDFVEFVIVFEKLIEYWDEFKGNAWFYNWSNHFYNTKLNL